LDLVTLNVLEQLLRGFPGSVLLVTHDRYFLDKVATRILSFEGEGRVVSYAGNYDMYRRLKAQSAGPVAAPPVWQAPREPTRAPESSARKLSYKEQRELEGMEAAIESAEGLLTSLEAELSSPQAYQLKEGVASLQGRVEVQRAEVDRLYARWQELQTLAGRAS
jgi:ATP-binding cassette subfamily F protein uup